jgi:hypothetical protein
MYEVDNVASAMALEAARTLSLGIYRQSKSKGK